MPRLSAMSQFHERVDHYWASVAQKRWTWFAAFVACLVPGIMVWVWSIQVPHADYWFMVADPYLHWRDGQGLLNALHEQVLHSRIDAARALHFLLIWATDMNMRADPMASLGLSIISALCFVALLQRFQPGGRTRAFVVAVLVVLIWFTPDRSMNWMYGVLVCWDLMVASLLLMLVALTQNWTLPVRTVAAAACALIACNSLVVGWLAWVVGLVVLLSEWDPQKPNRKVVGLCVSLWLVFVAVALLMYIHGFKPQARLDAPLSERLAQDPLAFAVYFLSLIGVPFTKGWPGLSHDTAIHFTESAAPWMGAMALGLLAAVLWSGFRGRWHSPRRSALPFLLITLWGALSTLAIAMARTGTAESSFFQSRYLAITLTFHFGLLALLALPGGRLWAWARATWLTLVAAGYIIGFANGLDQAKRDDLRYRSISSGAALRHVAPEPAYLEAVEPGRGPGVISHLDQLQERGLLHVPTLTGDRVSEAPKIDHGTIKGAIKRAGVMNGKPAVTVWAVDAAAHDAVDAVAISYQMDGGEECWLGMAQRRIVNTGAAARYGVKIPEDRVGWSYVHGAGTEHGFMSAAPNPIPPKPLPGAGRMVLRAYAFDLETAAFTKLDGEAAIELP